MGTTFNEFRRKLRRKRQKIKRARRAQAETKGNTHSRRSRKAIRTLHNTLMGALAVLALVVLVVLYVQKRTYNTYKVLKTSEQEDVVSTGYLEMDGKILRYSTDGVSLVNKQLDTVWSETYEMQEPMAEVCGDRAVIADQNGTSIRLYDKNGLTGSVTTSYSIVKVTLSKSGLAAAILDGGDETWIDLYSTDGSLIAENQTRIEDPGYPLDVALSEDGTVMMVAYQCVDGSETTSYVAFYNFGEVGQNEEDRIVSGYTYEGVVVPQIQCLEDHKAVAVRDDGFTIYKGRQIPKESKTVTVDKEIVSIFYDEDTIGLVFKNDSKDKLYTMQVYGTDGNLKFTKDFNIPYTTICISDGQILMYNSSQICILKKNGTEKYMGSVDGTINDFFKLGWNRYLLVLDTGIELVKFS